MAPNPELVTLARQIAGKHGLNDALVCAVVEQESSWDPNAVRYEPRFYSAYIQKLIVPLNLSPAEGAQRATSWGLMQLMGQVARELGYSGEIQDLRDPATGLDWGCKFFAQRLLKANGDAYAALQRWNGGGNPLYAGQVIAKMDKYILPLDNSEAVNDAATGEN